MKQYLKKTKERLYRGNGEFLAFSVVAVLICTITIYFIAIIQMSSCMDDLSKAVTAASRVVYWVALTQPTILHGLLDLVMTVVRLLNYGCKIQRTWTILQRLVDYTVLL